SHLINKFNDVINLENYTKSKAMSTLKTSDSYHGHSLKELPIINNTSNLSTICSGCMEWENLFINHSINLLQSTITTMREIQDNKLKNDSTLKEIKACVLVMLMVISNYV
ncbi:12779_t:CDS:2, partial [Entrophospora sp. SA101]